MSREIKFQFWGWVLFVICALLFLASSLRSGDILSILASIAFLVACVVFMIPLVQEILAGGPRGEPG